jgi:uncharacterized membrane protein (DUF485 family)
MKFKFRLFWSYDVIKTQKWLSSMSDKGYTLTKINFVFRLFYFKRSTPQHVNYMLIYDKGSNGFSSSTQKYLDFDEVCYSKNYYILKTRKEVIEDRPSYQQLLSRNQKLQYIVGIILLIILVVNSFPVLLILVSFFSGNLTVVTEPGGSVEAETLLEIVEGIITLFALLCVVLAHIWMIYTFFKLQSSNKKLIMLCGETIDLSVTVPRDTIMSKEEVIELKKEKRLVRRRKVGWFYSPDKCEVWLESMESKGFNLIRMSKIGNSFYFIKGETRRMKYHVDYQVKKDTTYFKLNQESGWKLFFTSLTRYFAISVWGQEYTQAPPAYYSDQESRVKHAKKFAFSYAVWLIPMSIMYFALCGFLGYGLFNSSYFRLNRWVVITPIMFLIVGLEFSIFAYRIVSYYYRVKKLS